jgi:hypothetical protein
MREQVNRITRSLARTLATSQKAGRKSSKTEFAEKKLCGSA